MCCQRLAGSRMCESDEINVESANATSFLVIAPGRTRVAAWSDFGQASRQRTLSRSTDRSQLVTAGRWFAFHGIVFRESAQPLDIRQFGTQLKTATPRIPISILTGFLGSGKTTVLMRLL